MPKVVLCWVDRAGNPETLALDLAAPSTKQLGKVRIGRDPEQCDVVLECERVSRLHAEISCDLHQQQYFLHNHREVNPIEVDGRPLYGGCAVLHTGSTATFGTQVLTIAHLEGIAPLVPAARVAEKPPQANFPARRPRVVVNPPPVRNDGGDVSLSQYIPLAFAGSDFQKNAFLVPGVLTVIWVLLLFANIGNSGAFNFFLALYLGCLGYYFIYRACDCPKPIWVACVPAILTPILLVTPVWGLIAVVFRDILPGQVPSDRAGLTAIGLFVTYFFGAGLAEELLKALSVFLTIGMGRLLGYPSSTILGVREPLDGILLGAASGLGFTLIETLGQYVPEFAASQGTEAGIQLLIPRIVGSVFGHMAYSGCFGYYIGLSVLKPGKRWQLLGVGYLLASIIHALWNTSSALGIWALGAIGILSYCLLMATILKARQLSPHHNFKRLLRR